MKKFHLTPIVIAAAFGLSAGLNAATSTPVGASNLTLSAGTALYSPVFVHSNAFQGAITGIAGSVLTRSGLTADAYNAGDFPAYYVEVTNDTDALDGIDTQGLILDVVSNTASQITVSGNVAGLNGDETIIIRKHSTIQELFANATGLTDGADTLSIYTDTTVKNYVYGAPDWYDLETELVANDTPVYPGTVVVTTFGAPVTLTAYGSVKVTPTQVPVYGDNVINLVGFIQPISGFQVDNADWSQIAEGADAISIYSNDGTLTAAGDYIRVGTELYDLATELPADPTVADVQGVVVIAGADTTVKIPAVAVAP